MDQAHCLYALGQRVGCVAEKLLPYGVFVCTVEGVRGYIRRRELSWAGDIDPAELVCEGQRFDAMVIELPSPDRTLELSLRATLPDPWKSFITAYRVGDIVCGVVKQLMPFGVFVELVPGVNGLVHCSELADWQVERAEDLLWPGDDVEAIITRIDGNTRRVGLSMRLRAKQHAEATPPNLAPGELVGSAGGNPPPIFTAAPAAQHTSIAEPPLDPHTVARLGPILVVDDEICGPLAAWLQRRGYQADAAATPEEARTCAGRRNYRVCLVDIDLPGMDGLTLIGHLRETLPDVQVAVMSIAEWLRERTGDIEQIGVVEVFVKPLDLTELERLLQRIAAGDLPYPWHSRAGAEPSSQVAPFQEPNVGARAGSSLAERLLDQIGNLVEQSRAEAGIIFAIDPSSRAISAPVQVGGPALSNDALYSLDDSPVKDVIRERRQICEGHAAAQAQQRKFRKLLDLLQFESCIGVPIEVQGECRHALFLFHRNVEAFSHYRLRDAAATAMLCAALLERDAFGRHVQTLGKFLLNGQLAAGFGHEVANEMSGLEIQLRNLRTDFDELAAGESQIRPGAAGELRVAIENLLGTAASLRNTVDLFQRLGRADDMSADVEETLRAAATLLRPIARRNKVTIAFGPRADLPRVASGIRLQQICLNVMLNAIQHVAAKRQGWGTLEVTAAYAPESHDLPIQIRFADAGPGIHKQLWSKIFELGFSTRPGGSGLGLFIARSLAESLGGRISVERSVVPRGTTFVVELRAVPKEGL